MMGDDDDESDNVDDDHSVMMGVLVYPSTFASQAYSVELAKAGANVLAMPAGSNFVDMMGGMFAAAAAAGQLYLKKRSK